MDGSVRVRVRCTQLAAWAPMAFVAVLFCLTLIKSSALQHVGKRMGLDKNKDGTVDFKDVVYAVTNSTCTRLRRTLTSSWLHQELTHTPRHEAASHTCTCAVCHRRGAACGMVSA